MSDLLFTLAVVALMLIADHVLTILKRTRPHLHAWIITGLACAAGYWAVQSHLPWMAVATVLATIDAVRYWTQLELDKLRKDITKNIGHEIARFNARDNRRRY